MSLFASLDQQQNIGTANDKRAVEVAYRKEFVVQCLITGGAGFIGSTLADKLIQTGHSVVAVDDLSGGSRCNVEHLRHSNFDLVVGSCGEREIMKGLARNADVIFHLASIVGVRRVLDSPVRTITSTYKLTETVLEAASARRCPVVIASSSEVYAKSTNFPLEETQDLGIGSPSVGRWSYACSKLLGEFLALGLWREQGLPTTVARIFNTSGPRQSGRYGMVLPNFIEQALANKPIIVHGDGSQTRCFTHIDDTVAGLLEMGFNSECHGEIFNVGGSSEISIKDLAYRVRERCESSSEIRFSAYEVAFGSGFEDIQRRQPDTSKLTAATGWSAKNNLNKIIDDMVEFYCSTNARNEYA